MSPKLPVISGAEMIRFLVKQGFTVQRQTSSHVIVQKDWRVFSVPLHKELKKGTEIAILKQAGIELSLFKKSYEK
ncbi:type II toxin-antitoxin system HicA family toxin [Methanocalculus taiwanensis]|uniref:Type II toxin-antitoxin system HicA family toxin n=2 Tax=Methanocalculus taiwanensis TaxID=106207 RepID=A0ABD4TMK2_9EURY|nr:type II toxin-antitoxin system HicA family toxin [Methanocalculus taiwanensis]